MGVVLAGGLSSRMLEDKSQLIWQGSSLLDHSGKLLLAAGCAEVVISNNSDPRYIADRFPDSGPLAGIDACLAYILNGTSEYEAMLIMPVDMPLMELELLRNLIHQAELGKAELSNSGNGKAVFYNAGRFPLILPVNDDLSKLLSSSLEQGHNGVRSGLSIRKLLANLDCQILDIDKDHQSAFYNCNTPEEWQNIQNSNL